MRTLRFLLGLMTIGTIACSGSGSEDVGATNDQLLDERAAPTIPMNATSIAGTFGVSIQNHVPRFSFTISNIDWQHHTAKWDAKVEDDDGYTAIENDRGLVVKINVARCPGCFSFQVEDLGQDLVFITVGNEKLGSFSYAGREARDVKITKVTTASQATAQDDDSDANTGACNRVCSGQPAGCKEGVTRDQCNADLFGGTVRCPTDYDFVPGGRCH